MLLVHDLLSAPADRRPVHVRLTTGSTGCHDRITGEQVCGEVVEARLSDRTDYGDPDQSGGLNVGIPDVLPQLLGEIWPELRTQHAVHRHRRHVRQFERALGSHGERVGERLLAHDPQRDPVTGLQVTLVEPVLELASQIIADSAFFAGQQCFELTASGHGTRRPGDGVHPYDRIRFFLGGEVGGLPRAHRHEHGGCHREAATARAKGISHVECCSG